MVRLATREPCKTIGKHVFLTILVRKGDTMMPNIKPLKILTGIMDPSKHEHGTMENPEGNHEIMKS